jgi:hypothetical protein
LLNSTAQLSYYLAVNTSVVGQQNINTAPAPPTLDLLNSSLPHAAGRPLTLQLNSSVIGTEFASMAASSTGWRVGLLRPDNSSADLGLMADWEVWQGALYKWTTSVHGSYLQLVSGVH